MCCGAFPERFAIEKESRSYDHFIEAGLQEIAYVLGPAPSQRKFGPDLLDRLFQRIGREAIGEIVGFANRDCRGLCQIAAEIGDHRGGIIGVDLCVM